MPENPDKPTQFADLRLRSAPADLRDTILSLPNTPEPKRRRRFSVILRLAAAAIWIAALGFQLAAIANDPAVETTASAEPNETAARLLAANVQIRQLLEESEISQP